jgi:hypothetical protein
MVNQLLEFSGFFTRPLTRPKNPSASYDIIYNPCFVHCPAPLSSPRPTTTLSNPVRAPEPRPQYGGGSAQALG